MKLNEEVKKNIPSKEEILEVRKKSFPPTAFLFYKNPIQLVKAKGNYVWDETGREYLDAFGGIVCNSAGHNHPKIQEALIDLIKNDEIQHTTTIYLNHHATELAKKIVSEAPKELDKCTFTNSGSEANEFAFLAARNSTNEQMIINLRHSYHGGTVATTANCGLHTWRFNSQPVSSVTSAMEPYCYRCPFDKKPESCSLECAKNVETTIQTSTSGRIAGMIAEGVMGIGGVISPPESYFHEVSKIVHNYGGKFIIDEVQTGAGRCGGKFLLTTELGIDADMITMAKGFGNGAAIGCVLLKSDISDTLTGKLYFNTFAADPYQTVQALKTMEIIEEENQIKNAKEMGEYIRSGLKDLMKKHEVIGDVRGRGLLLGVELVKDRKTKAHATKECADVLEICKDNGLLIGKGGLLGNVIRIAPSLSINKKQADFLIETLDKAFKSLENN